jgi:hypothetical protein
MASVQEWAGETDKRERSDALVSYVHAASTSYYIGGRHRSAFLHAINQAPWAFVRTVRRVYYYVVQHTHDILLSRLMWYRRWHGYRYHQVVHAGFLVAYAAVVGLVLDRIIY